MNPIEPILDRTGVVILDGALATELERRGADLRDPLWSAKILLEDPDLIRQVHHDYYAAGADIVTTASYQATLPGLMRRGLSAEQAADVLRLSVRLAEEAREAFLPSPSGRGAGGEGGTIPDLDIIEGASALTPNPSPKGRGGPDIRLIAASIGCYGAYLADGSEYRGDYGLTATQLRDWHRPRVEILGSSGADLLACETIPCLLEAEALVTLLADFPQTPAWLSFSCKDDRHLCHGEPLRRAVELANASPNVVAVGVNCTAPRFVEGLLASVADIARKPLLVYPNSGEAWDPGQRAWRSGVGEPDWSAYVRRWHGAGARVLGGCCRTTPATIRLIADALRTL